MARFLIVAMEGDLTASLAEIIRACGLKPTHPVQLFKDWKAVAPHVQTAGTLVAGYTGNWTILCDIGTLTNAVFVDPKRGEALAHEFKTRVVSALGEDTCCVYGFRIHLAGRTRAVLVRETVEQNSGEPIPGEPAVVAEEYNEEDVLEVLHLLGIDIQEGLEASGKTALIRYEEVPGGAA